MIKALLPLMLVLPTLGFASACRDSFVACVQKTGDPMSCQSLYQHCLAGKGAPGHRQADKPTAKVETSPTHDKGAENAPVFTTRLNHQYGMDMVSLYAENPNDRPVRLGEVRYTVRCADGRKEAVIFDLGGELQAHAGMAAVGSDQAVCVGSSAVALLDQTPSGMSSPAGSSILFTYQCSPDESHALHLTYVTLPNGKSFYRWRSSTGIRGAFTQGYIVQQDFVEKACGGLPAPSLVSKIKTELNALLRRIGYSHTGHSPEPGWTGTRQ